jgi:hypothetical protein
LADDLKCRRDEARDAIAVAQRKQRRLHDATRTSKEFNVGDLVILKFNRMGPGYKPPKDHRHKLGPLGTPLRIIEKLSPLSYRVALPANSRIHDIISIIHLRRYQGKDNGERPPPVVVDGEEEWEVERIDGERRNSAGGKEFLVKWKGYSEMKRTWEPIRHLDNTSELVAEWHARQLEAGDKSTEPVRGTLNQHHRRNPPDTFSPNSNQRSVVDGEQPPASQTPASRTSANSETPANNDTHSQFLFHTTPTPSTRLLKPHP